MHTLTTHSLVYRFSGAIRASNFSGVLPGDRFFGRFRIDEEAFAAVPSTGRNVADANGFVDAVVGSVQLRSSAPLEVGALADSAALRLALTARRPHPGDPLILVTAILSLSKRRLRDDGSRVAFGPRRGAPRILTLESAEVPGFAVGTLDMLYPLEPAMA